MIRGDYVLLANPLSLSVSFVAAFLTGVLACKAMIAIVKSANLKWFGYYCAIMGLVLITYKMFY
jgi:undecaprenyl-diphosphatase